MMPDFSHRPPTVLRPKRRTHKGGAVKKPSAVIYNPEALVKVLLWSYVVCCLPFIDYSVGWSLFPQAESTLLLPHTSDSEQKLSSPYQIHGCGYTEKDGIMEWNQLLQLHFFKIKDIYLPYRPRWDQANTLFRFWTITSSTQVLALIYMPPHWHNLPHTTLLLLSYNWVKLKLRGIIHTLQSHTQSLYIGVRIFNVHQGYTSINPTRNQRKRGSF